MHFLAPPFGGVRFRWATRYKYLFFVAHSVFQMQYCTQYIPLRSDCAGRRIGCRRRYRSSWRRKIKDFFLEFRKLTSSNYITWSRTRRGDRSCKARSQSRSRTPSGREEDPAGSRRSSPGRGNRGRRSHRRRWRPGANFTKITVLHFYTFTFLHFYTSTFIHFYIPTFLHFYSSGKVVYFKTSFPYVIQGKLYKTYIITML